MVGAQTSAAKDAGETQRQTKTMAYVVRTMVVLVAIEKMVSITVMVALMKMATLTETTTMVTTMAMQKPTSICITRATSV